LAPVEIWLKALGEHASLSLLPDRLTPCQDLLFERLQMNYDLSKIKAIAGAAQVGSVKVYRLVDQTIPLRKTDLLVYFRQLQSVL
jgi:hypothetical protein